MEEADDSCKTIVYNREKKRVLDDMDKLRDNLKELQSEEIFFDLFEQTIDEFIADQTLKAVTNLKDKYYPKVVIPPNESTHLWIGINPPRKTYTILELDQLMASATIKYKFLEKHAYTLEAHTDGGYRPHIHAMALTNAKPGRVITALSNHFKVDKPSIECKAFHKGYLFGEHYDYITGQKVQEKKTNVSADISEKEALGISNFVQNIFL